MVLLSPCPPSDPTLNEPSMHHPAIEEAVRPAVRHGARDSLSSGRETTEAELIVSSAVLARESPPPRLPLTPRVPLARTARARALPRSALLAERTARAHALALSLASLTGSTRAGAPTLAALAQLVDEVRARAVVAVFVVVVALASSSSAAHAWRRAVPQRGPAR